MASGSADSFAIPPETALTPAAGLRFSYAIPKTQPEKPHFMSDKPSPDDDFIHSDEFLYDLMKRQLRLSLACAAAFLLLLFGLPLLNYFLPEVMAKRIGGFTLSWLLLGVLFFPYVWIIAKVFIVRSIALEQAEVREVRAKTDRN